MIPYRMCAVCRRMLPKSELIRFVSCDGSVVIDASGKLDGRGCYLCGETKCMSKAIKSNVIAKSLKTSFDVETIKELLSEYADKQ